MKMISLLRILIYSTSISVIVGIRSILQEAFQLHLNRIITKPINRTVFQSYFQHAECMKEWIGNQSHSIRIKINELFGFRENPVEMLASNQVYVVSGVPSTMPSEYFHHFPHFADLYLRFYSLLLWQGHRYQENKLLKPLVHYFLVNSSYHYFWSDLAKRKGWNYGMITHVNNAFGKNLIISDVAPSKIHNKSFIYLQSLETDVKFLHPADALVLSHALMNQDPCQLHRGSEELLKKPIHILIVNRTTRGILNMNAVYSAIAPSFLQSSGSSEWSISLHTFEEYSFLRQVQLSFASDIFFTSHGAALTNLIFMKPCSIVIEVLPWLYVSQNQFFARYARSVDVLHYEWMEGPNTTISHPRTGKYRKCFDLLQEYRERQSTSPYFELFQTQQLRSPHSLNAVCMNDSSCRHCSRTIRGLDVNTTRLSTILLQALTDRQQCIKSHPFYRS